jgi:hypothetical protein
MRLHSLIDDEPDGDANRKGHGAEQPQLPVLRWVPEHLDYLIPMMVNKNGDARIS